jgi:hypothetical protein
MYINHKSNNKFFTGNPKTKDNNVRAATIYVVVKLKVMDEILHICKILVTV